VRAERDLSFTRRADQLSLACWLRFPLTDSVQWRRAIIGNSTGSENKTRFLARDPQLYELRAAVCFEVNSASPTTASAVMLSLPDALKEPSLDD